MIELPACIGKDVSNSDDLLLCEVPIVVLNSTTDTGKVLSVIPIPCFRRKDDVLELLSTWKLQFLPVSEKTIRQKALLDVRHHPQGPVGSSQNLPFEYCGLFV